MKFQLLCIASIRDAPVQQGHEMLQPGLRYVDSRGGGRLLLSLLSHPGLLVWSLFCCSCIISTWSPPPLGRCLLVAPRCPPPPRRSPLLPSSCPSCPA